MQSDEIVQLLKRVAQQWDKTEKLLKTVEMLDGELTMPSINELRYAGRRLVDAIHEANLPSPDLEKVRAFVAEVELFCFRAQHDAIDTVIYYLRKRIIQMEDAFGHRLLLEKCHNYTALKVEINHISKIIVESRGHRGMRYEIYNDIQDNKFPLIWKYANQLFTSETALVAIAEKEKADGISLEKALQEARLAKRWTVVSACIAGLVGAACIWLGYKQLQAANAQVQPTTVSTKIEEPIQKDLKGIAPVQTALPVQQSTPILQNP